MQMAKIPRNICDSIDKKMHRFIWGGDEHTRKIHLLSWDTLQKPRNEGGVGLKSARLANATFLTKLGWHVLTEPNALWSRVIRHKYYKGRCDIDMFHPTTNMSNVWKGITNNVQWLKKGSSVAIGNGKITIFWDHCWATKIPLRHQATSVIPTKFDGATVEEMWLEGHGWCWDNFANVLPPTAIKKIAAHKLVEDPQVGDHWGIFHQVCITNHERR